MPINYVDFGFAGGVRSHVASKPDRSFDPNSTFGRISFLPKFGLVCASFLAGAFLSRNNKYLAVQTYLSDFLIC